MYGINNILSSVSDTLTPPESLTGYGDTYIVTDLRKRGKKEPNEVKSLKAFRFVKNADAPKLFENVEPIKPDWFGVYKVFKGVDNGIIYLQYTFKKDYNADFLLNNYSIDENAKKITLTFDYVKAWNTKGYTAIRVSNVVMSLPVCNITFTNDIEVSGLFGLYDFVEGYIKALKNAQSNYRANSNDYKDLQYNIERYQTAWNKYAAQESAPVESPKAPAPEKAQESAPVESTEPTPEPEKAQESAPESPAPESEIFNDAETVEIENTPVKNAAEPNWSAIEKDMARAKYWSSFDPEKSAKYETDYYKAVYNEVLKDVPADYVDRFNDIFNGKVYELISLQSKAPNAAVTGNGGVSASKARKYNAANDRLMETRAKFDDYMKYIARRLAANARRKEFIESTPEQRENAEFEKLKKDVDYLIALKKDIEDFKKNPTKYRAENNIKEGEYWKEPDSYSLQNKKATFYDKLWRVGAKGYSNAVNKILDLLRDNKLYTDKHKIFSVLKNNNNYNNYAANEFAEMQNYDGVKVVNNQSLDRLQIFFDSIPADDVRTALKSRGFRWSPREKAWQRQYTRDAVYAANNILEKYYKKEGLGKPTIKFEFNNNDELKAFLNDNKENLIDSYIDADIADDAPLNAKKIAVNGVGNPPAGIFNCPESELICNGFVPTYQRLDDYSHLIDTAENNNVLKGYGFDDTTLNTLIDAVKHYKQVERLAYHLKADTPEQTAFNIWHWLHCNIAYNYDTQGIEEIRTPARTWSDRKSGVDCDCLSVFTAALLINLGYHPKFEIVAFANKPQFSHIYVNLDGLAIDRVLPTFNRRPLLITKTMLMDIPVYQLTGLSGINAELQGVYENALRRYAHTQDGEDLLNMRKTQILVSLQGSDYNGFRLAGLLMPYVQGIDDDGSYYFDNEEIANIAANADNDVIAAEMRGASEQELGKLFKKIGKALKKAAKKVGSAVKAVAKTTAKAVTTVAKTTAKATKAAVKSAVNTVKATANVVKAGAQAVVGKGSAAKATLKKAGQQVKAAVVQPVKTAVQNTKAVVKNVVVEPTKTAVKVTIVEPTKTLVKAVAKTIKIAGKIFKVILVKINPITVLMRNSLRLLIAVNFLGMATRLNVANMTQAAAIAAGYTAAQWNDAKKAYDRVIKFFTKMGGKRENIEKAIVNGAKKKALFKKDYKLNSQIIEKGSDDATLSGTGVILNGLDGLGAAVTIGSALAAVGAFFKTIWKWLCKVVPKAAKATVNVVKKVAQNDDVKKIATAAKDAAVNKAVETVTKKIGGNTTTPTTPTTPDILPPDTTPKKSNNWLKWALIAAAGVTVVGLAASGKKKRKKAA